MSNYWLILDNYVHLSIKRNQVLLYNPLNGIILEYKEKPAVLRLARRLLSPRNNYVIRLRGKELKNPETAHFIDDLHKSTMGDRVDASLVKEKPIQMMPIIKIHRDAEEIKKHPSRSVGEGMMSYPAEISLYINGNCPYGCTMCGQAFKQFPCCTKEKSRIQAWDAETIKKILDQLQSAPLQRLNIIGGNIFLYPHLDQLAALLEKQSHFPEKRLIIHYLNMFNQDEKISLFPHGLASFLIIVSFPVRPLVLEKVVDSLHRNNSSNSAEFQFVVTSEDDVAETEKWIHRHGIEHYSLVPYYDGTNQAFFHENIFLDKVDIKEARPTQTDILARQVVNPLQFGQLTILNNGAIHGNVNTQRLGAIATHSLYKAVHKEMLQGKNWRRVRAKIKPCRSCNFNALCPPLSNYEYALKQNNLCHIWRNKPEK